MGLVENEYNDQVFENEEISGTAITDFANDWEVSHRSTPNTITSNLQSKFNFPSLSYIALLDQTKWFEDDEKIHSHEAES